MQGTQSCDRAARLRRGGAVALLVLLASGAAFAAPADVSGPEGITVRNRPDGDGQYVIVTGSADKISDFYRRANFALDRVREHGQVPPVFVAALPHDLTEIRMSSDRKAMFIKMALPLILHVNQRLGRQRVRLSYLRAIQKAGIPLSPPDHEWLSEMASRYDTPPGDLDALLKRVDIIPPSLALAQAAEESGWGTSRFAREGNALFGQRIYRGKDGLVPIERDTGESYRVREFNQLVDGVRAYAFNLNTHPAYEDFRQARAEMRTRKGTLDSLALARTLTLYSERRDAYVETIEGIIRANHLTGFDDVRLGDRIQIATDKPDA